MSNHRKNKQTQICKPVKYSKPNPLDNLITVEDTMIVEEIVKKDGCVRIRRCARKSVSTLFQHRLPKK